MTAAIQWADSGNLLGHESACGHYRIRRRAEGGYLLTVDNVKLKISSSLSLMCDYADVIHEVRHGGPPAELVQAARRMGRIVSEPIGDGERGRYGYAAQTRCERLNRQAESFLNSVRGHEEACAECPLLSWALDLCEAYRLTTSKGAIKIWATLANSGLIAPPPAAE